MKTKELIERLKKADTEGNAEVISYNGQGVFDMHVLPGFFDGCYQQVETDNLGYVTKIKYKTSGEKLILISKSTVDHLDLNQKIEIDYSELNERTQNKLKELHANYINWYHDMLYGLELDYFVEWCLFKIKGMIGVSAKLEETDIKNTIRDFFKNNNSRFDPLPTSTNNLSYVDARRKQWEEIIEISFKDGMLNLIKK